MREIATARKKKLVLIIDEASLLRLDVFAELHTITQFDADSNPLLPIILAGQNSLADLLTYRTSLPLASRIVARTHLQGVSRQDMEAYLIHHLKIAGVKNKPFCRCRRHSHTARLRRALPKGQPPGPGRAHRGRQRKSATGSR